MNYNLLIFFSTAADEVVINRLCDETFQKQFSKPGPYYRGLVSTFSQCMQCAFCLTFLWGQAVMPMGLATTPRGSARHAQRKSGRLEENKPLSRKGWKLTTFDTLSVFLRAIYSTTLKYGGAYCSDGVSATNIL